MIPNLHHFHSEIANLNKNLQNLGKYSRTGLHWSKSFLSFDKDDHINIRHLNVFQILARKFLGCYQDTVLENVIKRWNDYQIRHGNICPELNEKLATLWSKNHSKPILQDLNETYFIGNSTIENAEVVGIGQLFSHPHNSKFCNDLLSRHYREGDVILVEGVDAGKRIHMRQSPQTALLSKPVEIYGLEPVGYEALNAKVFESVIAIENQLTSNAWLALKLIHNYNFLADPQQFVFESALGDSTSYTQLEKEKLWLQLFNEAVENFCKAILKIENYFEDSERAVEKPVISRLEEFKKNYRSFMQSSKSNEDCISFANILQNIFTNYEDSFQKKKYTEKWTAVQNNFFKNTWDVRQKSLVNELDYYRQLGKRVFVCAGAAHFFPNRWQNDSPVVSALKQHKFTIGLSNIKENATYYSFEELTKKYE